MKQADDLANMVLDNPDAGTFRVLREAMTSEDVLRLERERIFDRTWLYVGHASEVAKPGDFIRREIAGRPLILIRGIDGEVRCFLNSCTHRGARVCRQDAGNAKSFQCFYHAWTFDTTGALRGLPDEAGYGEHFDRAEFALKRPAKLDCYRDFYFVSFSPDVEDLYDYLGGAREYIDLIVDQGAGQGGMKVVQGSQPYSCGANWKLMVENSIDGYHGAPVHQTYFEFVANRGDVSHLVKNLSSPEARGFSLGNGHSVIDYPAAFPRAVAFWHPVFGEDAREDVEAAMEELVDAHGQARAERMAKTCRNLFIYPNLLLLDVAGLTIRTVWPTTADQMEVNAWALAPAEESPARLKRRIEGFNLFLGPGGLATPDDIEALEACQQGFAATRDVYSDISRGMKRDAQAIDEAQMRAFWREWHSHMLLNGHAEHRELRQVQVPLAKESAPAVYGAEPT